ncbi:M15 family metallopeptidase [Psychromarinibacter sp. C21-152]|uniref:M15 family metallopeptidase n=1 Tax=Psychromarinibacter sediminicola TaxID=3033385 RepID=A0AAE3NPU2_9RHOB|nr:M15 family metallopeptidase [Psychromarinibacter sediminicola]MDF0599891.1 M15 family metallopeptidase [Psychromarinibacter sediminicola]
MRRLALALLVALAAPAAGAQTCTATDWMAVPLPGGGDLMETALETAYPGTDLDRPAGTFVTDDGRTVPYRGDRDVSPADRLDDATIGDMFVYPYPLAFDLSARRTPWFDPGRVRNDALMRALWFDDAAAARASLAVARYQGYSTSADFAVTSKRCVHAQLQAALDQIATHGAGMDKFLVPNGGTFNWRTISGTDRLSAHSFGIAVDFNTELGGYWRWSGAQPGNAAAYDNRYPPDLVQAMERYGFIWGGKWHHFDGMHFEYRPELILFARLLRG